ncbi:MAG: helicase C-terminal domain-containing protein [Eubacterium sp.]
MPTYTPASTRFFRRAAALIRTSSDRGVILLLDERFAGNSYSHLFPKEWVPYKITNKKGMKDILHSFWENPDSSPD